MLPKLIITDIDGVWTNGGMYYDQHGNEWKKFNTSDSAGVLFAHHLNIPIAILTGEDTEIVARRARKLNIEYLVQGCDDKVQEAKRICHELNISLTETAYIGDDIGDIELLRAAGVSGAPKNAPEYVRSEVDYTTKTSGGKGAFREFVEWIISQECDVKELVDQLIVRNSNQE